MGSGRNKQERILQGVRLKQSIAMTLPEPLSVNRMYRSYQGRVLISREGRAYKKAVAAIVCASRVRFGDKKRLRLEMLVFKGSRRRADLDNCVKVLQDSLEHGGLYGNDSQIDELIVKRGPVDKLNPRVEIVVTEI